MKTAFRAIVGVVLVLGVILFAVVSMSLGKIVKTAVETAGPRVLGAPVTLGLVTVSPFSGAASLRGLVIGNPEGYKSAHAVKVDLVSVRLKPASLLTDTIVVESVEVKGPELIWEVGGSRSNLAQLQLNAQNAIPSSSGAKETPAAPAKKGKSLLIKRLDVTGGKVGLSATALGGQGMSAPLPELHLTDLGGKGKSPAEAAAQVLRAVTGSAQQAVTNIGSKALDAASALGNLFKKVK